MNQWALAKAMGDEPDASAYRLTKSTARLRKAKTTHPQCLTAQPDCVPIGATERGSPTERLKNGPFFPKKGEIAPCQKGGVPPYWPLRLTLESKSPLTRCHRSGFHPGRCSAWIRPPIGSFIGAHCRWHIIQDPKVVSTDDCKPLFTKTVVRRKHSTNEGTSLRGCIPASVALPTTGWRCWKNQR